MKLNSLAKRVQKLEGPSSAKSCSECSPEALGGFCEVEGRSVLCVPSGAPPFHLAEACELELILEATEQAPVVSSQRSCSGCGRRWLEETYALGPETAEVIERIRERAKAGTEPKPHILGRVDGVRT